MNYAYSADTNMFYPLSLRAEYEQNAGWPSNYIEVSDDIFSVFTEYVEGKIRVAGSDGLPNWADVPQQTKKQLIQLAEQQRSDLRATADSEIVWRQDAVDAEIATEEETADLAVWKKYRVLLMRVDTSKVPDIKLPIQPGAQAS